MGVSKNHFNLHDDYESLDHPALVDDEEDSLGLQGDEDESTVHQPRQEVD